MYEFKVNNYISLKLENRNTVIYVTGERFRQCKYLLINIPVDNIIKLNQLESIDEITNTLDSSLELITKTREDHYIYNTPPEEGFWAHCSNLQAWAENEYDTRLLHSNLAFPLLKKLAQSGDKKATKVFKEEIAKRIESNYLPVIQYLWNEGFFKYLEEEELLTIPNPNVNEFKNLIDIENLISRKFTMVDTIKNKENEQVMYSMNEKGISELEITNNPDLEVIPESIIEFKNLKYLTMIDNSIEFIPESIGKLKNLKKLDLKINRITKIPNLIKNCRNLKKINLSSNFITDLPQSVGKLKLLEELNIDINSLSNIPDSLGSLSSLKVLDLSNNHINSVPDSIGSLSSLKVLNLSSNQLTSVPDSIGTLHSLERLYLTDNQLTSIPDTIGNLRSLKSITFDNNAELKSLPSDILNIESLNYIQVDYKQASKIRELLTKLNEKKIHILKINEKE